MSDDEHRSDLMVMRDWYYALAEMQDLLGPDVLSYRICDPAVGDLVKRLSSLLAEIESRRLWPSLARFGWR